MCDIYHIYMWYTYIHLYMSYISYICVIDIYTFIYISYMCDRHMYIYIYHIYHTLLVCLTIHSRVWVSIWKTWASVNSQKCGAVDRSMVLWTVPPVCQHVPFFITLLMPLIVPGRICLESFSLHCIKGWVTAGQSLGSTKKQHPGEYQSVGRLDVSMWKDP